MKRKEEINKAAMKYLQRTTPNQIQTCSTILKTFKAGAKWADENVSLKMVIKIWNLATKTAIAQINKDMPYFKSEEEIRENIKKHLKL
jgi:hypothetical protein|nr:MAG TPA: hypothetical protein [Bacteriophage sp.]